MNDRAQDRPLLEARDLRVGLGQGRRLEAGLSLEAGEALQVAGPSGCGKTTLLRVLARLSAPEGGQLLLGGRPASQVRPASWRRQVQYLAQQPVLFDGTVRDNLTAGFACSRAPAPPPDLERQAGELLRELDLDPGAVLSQDARTLSGGEAARVALCRALLVQPPVLLADEPSAALDSERAGRLARLLSRWIGEGGALVLVAHDDAPWEGLDRRRLELGGPA